MSDRPRCKHCSKDFGRSDSLLLHLRKFHPLADDLASFYKKSGAGSKCPECGDCFFKLSDLCGHVSAHHKVNLIYAAHEFSSEKEFLTWLLQEEEATASKFVKRGKNHLYVCHRSGIFKPRVEVRQRKLKSSGSYKIGATCTAHIRYLIEVTGKITILYQQIHFGHDLEPGTLKLTKSVKAKRIRGVLRKRIIEDLAEENADDSRRDADADDTDDSKDELLPTQDVANIERAYGNSVLSKTGQISDFKRACVSPKGSQPTSTKHPTSDVDLLNALDDLRNVIIRRSGAVDEVSRIAVMQKMRQCMKILDGDVTSQTLAWADEAQGAEQKNKKTCLRKKQEKIKASNLPSSRDKIAVVRRVRKNLELP